MPIHTRETGEVQDSDRELLKNRIHTLETERNQKNKLK